MNLETKMNFLALMFFTFTNHRDCKKIKWSMYFNRYCRHFSPTPSNKPKTHAQTILKTIWQGAIWYFCKLFPLLKIAKFSDLNSCRNYWMNKMMRQESVLFFYGEVFDLNLRYPMIHRIFPCIIKKRKFCNQRLFWPKEKKSSICQVILFAKGGEKILVVQFWKFTSVIRRYIQSFSQSFSFWVFFTYNYNFHRFM